MLAKELLREYDGRPVGDGPDFVTRYFACCANIGLGAALARRANSGIRGVMGDVAGTFISLLLTLLTYRPQDFTMCCDGFEEKVKRVHNISLGKTYHIASGIKVNNELECGDDRFYSLLVQNMKLRHLSDIIQRVYSGRKLASDHITTLRYLKTIDIYGNSCCPEVEFDGDPAGFLPCSISMAADKLELLCRGMPEQVGHQVIQENVLR